jgi:hypothetical protein
MSETTPASDDDDQANREPEGECDNESESRELDDLPTDSNSEQSKDVESDEVPPAPHRTRKVRNPIESEEYFGVQYSKTSDLPDPVESLKVLATGVVEVIAGTRQVEQLARWLSDDVYQRLQYRARRAEAQRTEQGIKAHYQNLSVGGLRTCSPRDGVIESVILLSSKSRTRAVTIRLEGINARWRATSVSVL